MSFYGSLPGTVVSIVNSTASLLSSGATFLGTSEDVQGYSTITVSILGTLSTATGTLFFETSSDNVTWSQVPREITNITADVPHVWLIAEQYFRVRYVNDSIAQTGAFRIQTMFANGRPMALAHTVENEISINSDVLLSRVVSNTDLDFARKLITGQRSFFFFGYNDSVGTSWEDIHPNGGDINWQTAVQSVEVVSTDAADNGTTPGLGVQSVEIHGLSATGEDQDEIVLTNGTTAVAAALTYIRVNKMHSEICGTYGGSHQGDITCQVSGGGAVLSKMTGEEGSVDTAVVYGSGEAGNGYWSIPLGKVMYITRLEVIPNVGTNKTIDIALYERENILDVTTPFAPRRVIWQESGIDTTTEKVFKSHIKIKALTDIWFRAKASATSKIEVSLDFYLVNANSSGE